MGWRKGNRYCSLIQIFQLPVLGLSYAFNSFPSISEDENSFSSQDLQSWVISSSCHPYCGEVGKVKPQVIKYLDKAHGRAPGNYVW